MRAASQALEKIEEVGRNVQTAIDHAREPAAGKLQSAALALRDKAHNLAGQTVGELARSAADRLEATAGYVRVHNLQDMRADAETFVRKYPGQSLIAAAALGFLVGRTFRRAA